MSVDLARLIAQSFTRFGEPIGVKACSLIKATAGARDSGNVTAGPAITTTSYAARGLVAEYSSYDIANSLVQAGDRKVILFGASITGGAVPVPGDQILIGGETLTIAANGVKSDPVAATYTCQCRR